MASQSAEVLEWIVARVAAMRGLDPRAIDVNERFSHYGLDSIGATRLTAELGGLVGRPLPATLVWEHPTFAALAAHVSGGAESAAPGPTVTSTPDEPIAVIGIACRFPGARDPASFWRLLCDGRDAIGDVPADRGWAAALTAHGLTPSERARACRGGFLERIDGFDPLFFGISPREASSMDPQQRLMLELAWEALEDAGVRPSLLRGSATGAFVGAIWSDHGIRLYREGIGRFGQHTVTGYHHSIIANRISYLFGLEGPSFTVDSACSSGLVVVHLACESLRRGESTLALAGAVNLNVLADSAIGVSRFGALSEDGRCYTFDARANGYVRGEGGGVVVLKALGRALSDGDSIRCVIRGSAVNNDGASNGMTAPSRRAQEAVLRAAYRRAGVDPATVQYVEAHGTGTPLGDPIEARALGAVLGAARPAHAPLLVGSAKTNVGHLEGAAGLVGLTKVALAIGQRQLPPSLNFAAQNPHAPLAELHLDVPVALGPWPAPERSLVAGVSSFGLGGTNGHVVVEEWPGPRAELLALAAPSPADLQAAAAAVSISAATPLATICADAACRVGRGPDRFAVVARSHAGLARSLDALVRDGAGPARAADFARGVVFVCPGQGAQWFGMARALLAGEPVVRATLEECDQHVKELLGWSLLGELTAPRARSRLDDIEVSLPAIIAIDIAVARWWRSVGIEPAAVVGHSTGEIAAAHIAGALDLADTMRVICAYGRVIGRSSGQGAMALVAVPWDAAAALVAGYEGRVFRAIQDSAAATVLAGEPAALAALAAELQTRGVLCRPVSMNVAPHCPRVDSMRAELFDALRHVRPRRTTIPLVSEVTGTEVDGRSLHATHWVRNFGDPAFFARAVDSLIGRGHRLFLDVGPHPITKHSVETNLRHAGAAGVVLASLRRDEDERGTLLESLAALHTLGAEVRWGELYPTAGTAERAWLLPLSARSPQALAARAESVAAFLRDGGRAARLEDIAFTASARRDHHGHRLACVGRTHEELAEALSTLARGDTGLAPKRGAGLVFVFPGQGSQWLGRGRQLLAEEPAFRTALEAADAAIRRESGFSGLDELAADEASSRLTDIDVVQPTLFAIEVALAALWRAWGIEPDAVVGHSMGEVAAAHVAGILSLDDAVQVICRRSRLLLRVRGAGAMALVELAPGEAEAALLPSQDRLSVAVHSGPRSTVLSGDPAALDEVLAALEARSVFCRRIKVDVASHSPQMDPLQDDLGAALAAVRPGVGRVPMLSTVTGALVHGPELDASYWVQNLRAPVMFADAVRALARAGHGLFVEVSPHPVLVPALEENLLGNGVAVPSLRRGMGERRALLDALGVLHVQGRDVDWTRLFPTGGRLVPLPAYPWQRERYWISDAGPRRTRGGHPLLGEAFSPADRPDAHYWEQRLAADAPAYLGHHRVEGQVVLPAAAYVEIAVAAAAAVHGGSDIVVEDVAFERMLVLPSDGETHVQVALVEAEDGRARITVSSRVDEASGWRRHASATARVGLEPAPRPESPDRIRERCPVMVEPDEHLACMTARRIDYGAAFQGVTGIAVGPDEALARVRLPDAAGDAGGHLVHPALLDACLQVSTVFVDAAADATVVPVAIDRVRLHVRPPAEVWVHARRAGDGCDLAMIGADGELLVEVGGLRLSRVDHAPVDRLAGCALSVAWRKVELSAPVDATQGSWLILSDQGGVGAALGDALCRRGQTCVEIAGPEDIRRLLRAAAPVRGVVHMRSLDAAAPEGATLDRLLADVAHGTWSALELTQALAALGTRDVPRLVLVTRGAQPVGGGPVSIAQATLPGLARTVALELPDLRCTRVDLPRTPGSDDVERLVRELLGPDGEEEIALRADGRFVARLERGAVEPGEPPALSPAATYVITGGLGGLGLAVARWLVARGARHLVLVGRNGPGAAARDAVRAMTETGADVRVMPGDVARAEDVAAILGAIKGGMPPLRGVVHAAGVLDDRTLQGMTEEQFWSPLRPKLSGAWNLHTQTLDAPLDFFVLFSSAASLLGSAGQGNYAAANAFLDALAHLRAAHGLPATAIQWGAFSEVGLAAAKENRGERLYHRGIESLTPDEGTVLLGRVLRRPRPEIGLVRLSVRQWLEFHPRMAASPFFAELGEAEWRPQPTRRPHGAARAEIERHVVEALGRVLRVPAARVEPGTPFKDYGMDSLLSLEIRNRLEATLGLRLSATVLFTYPTTGALVEHLTGELRGDEPAAPELGDAAAAALLDEKLLDLEGYLK
jgi:acyl transferase domain-containing protein/acyl carrier protein